LQSSQFLVRSFQFRFAYCEALDCELGTANYELSVETPLLPGFAYPWRCLCFAFSQITRTTPRRVMTLHLTQIFFTDARTFICYCPSPHSENRSAKFQNSFQQSAVSLQFCPAGASYRGPPATIEAES
jgi:hypothetical protein